MRNVYDIEHGNSKENITALMTFSAAGHVVTPLIVYPYVRIPNDIRETIPDGFAIDKSANGWMNSDVFCAFIKDTFYADLVKNNVKFPVVLFVDGHTSHVSYKASEMCNELQIILVCLYPNATRILQPADVSVFKPLKSGWHEAVFIWKRQNTDKILTKVKFARILKIVVDTFIKKTTIENGFRTCGLYPWNADAVDYSKCLGKNYEPIPSESNLSNAIVESQGIDCESSLKAIDFKRFCEIVDTDKLSSLSQFDGSGDVSSDFLLLHSIFKELKDDKHVPGNCGAIDKEPLGEHAESEEDVNSIYLEEVRFFL